MPSLAPSYSMSILKLNVMRAPEMASIFGIWGLYVEMLPKGNSNLLATKFNYTNAAMKWPKIFKFSETSSPFYPDIEKFNTHATKKF